jgi:hypothetical protein
MIKAYLSRTVEPFTQAQYQVPGAVLRSAKGVGKAIIEYLSVLKSDRRPLLALEFSEIGRLLDPVEG